MQTLKQINKNRHIVLEKHATTLILLTSNIYHGKYKSSTLQL